MREQVQPLSLELSFARPTNPEYYPNDQWSARWLGLLNEIGGASVRLNLTTDQRSHDRERRRLAGRIRQAALAFVDSGVARVARLDVLDEDGCHPIDLIADRLDSRQPVEMNGHYPVPEAMYAALRRAVDEQREALDAILGRPGHRLR